MMRPLFSIITVSWNAETEIERTLRSVSSQSCDDYEYIIVDGGSKDGTLLVIDQYKECVNILISEPDKGIYNAMNKGIHLAHGKYAIFMNAGDAFASNSVLSEVMEQISHAIEELALVYGNYVRVNGDDVTQEIPARSAQKVWYGMFASHQSMFYNLDYLRKEGLEYDESYKIAADYKLTLEIVHRAGVNRVMQMPVCVARFGLGGVSHANQNAGLKEADMARKEVLHMSALKRIIIRMMQYCARPLRENKIFKAIYSKLRY